MADGRPVDVVLAWHMHQPDYRDHESGTFRMPWVYLHALKDYTDMAAHLERHPGVRGVVNFVPILAEQLEDYVAQFDTGHWRDPLLALLARAPQPALVAQERELALDWCFHANHQKMIEPFAGFRRLRELYRAALAQGRGALDYLSDQYHFDLLTWYHLAWTGETVRRDSPLVAQLMAQGEGFTPGQRQALLGLIGTYVRGVLPRYRRLAQEGRIELSTTPYWHPLGPLLIDFASARESEPAAGLPQASAYPGGRERFARHLDAALDSHGRRFGAPARGLWPAEGAVSEPLLALLGERRLAWTASSEGVLAHSLRTRPGEAPPRGSFLYRPYRLPRIAPDLSVFFRDDRLSDLIGFEYARWNSDEAAADFIRQIEAAASAAPAGERPVVSVILDGENAWEYYPYNGYYFLDGLYTRLEAHGTIRTHTFAGYLEARAAGKLDAGGGRAAAFGELERVVAGSWVGGTLATWIGSPQKNRAWDLLAEAKRSFDLALAGGRLDRAAIDAAERQLADCEASDWFWWFGDYNPEHAVAAFDRLFRANLARLYGLLGLSAPASLQHALGQGSGDPEAGGTMRRAA